MRDRAGDLVAVFAGAVLIRLGFGFHVQFLDGTGLAGVVVQLTLIALGLACFAAAVSHLPARRYAPDLAGMALAAVAMAWVVRLLVHPSGGIGTDAMLYSQYAVDLLLAGENPYAHSMRPAFERYGVEDMVGTELATGGRVETFSYPALSIWWFLPQRLLGIPNLNLTTVGVLVATLAYLSVEAPDEYALAPLAALFATPNLLNFAAGGIFDLLWVLPLLVAMKCWHEQRYVAASVLLGIASATKPQAWLVLPFLAVWLFRAAPTTQAFLKRARTCISWGLVAFLVPNLPFIVWDPLAWLASLDRAIGLFRPPMVQDGVGLVAISTHGPVAIPSGILTGLVVAVLAGLLGLYWRAWPDGRWLAWIAPTLLLFVHYRSMHNYFLFFVPVAFYVVLLQGREDQAGSRETEQPPESSTAQSTGGRPDA